MARIRVAFVTEVLAEYKLHLHRGLAELADYEVVVWHGPERPGSLPVDADPGDALPHRSARNLHLGGRLVWQRLGAELRAFDPEILVLEDGVRLLSHWPLLGHARRRHVPVVLYTHGLDTRPPPPRDRPLERLRVALAGRLRQTLHHQAAALIFYNGVSARRYRRDHPERPCFVATNTLDLDSIRAQLAALPADHRWTLRRQLGVPEGGLLIANVGRLIPEHDPRPLFEAVRAARQAGASCHVLSIGGGPLEAERQAWVDALPAAERDAYHLLPRRPLDETTRLLAACDVLVLPSAVGLAIVHGFAVGLPCIAVRTEPTGPELAYLEPGVNGLLLEDAGPSLSAALLRVERETRLLGELGEGARRFAARELSPERQLLGFVEAFEFVRQRRAPRVLWRGSPSP